MTMSERGREMMERVRQLFVALAELQNTNPSDAHQVMTAMVAHIRSVDAPAITDPGAELSNQ